MKMNLSVLFLALTLVACTQQHQGAIDANGSAALRAQTQAERLSDFDSVVTSIRELYGPLEYKERRFNYKFNDLVTEYRKLAEAAKDDAQAYGVLLQLLGRLQDGHVSLSLPAVQSLSYTVPILLTPVEGKAVVGLLVDETLKDSHNIEVGDVVLEVDGRPTMDYMSTIMKYDTFGNAESDQHFVARVLRRPLYITELIPTKPTVSIKIQKASGEIIERSLIWTMGPSAFAEGRRLVMSPKASVAPRALKEAFSPKAAEFATAHLRQMGLEQPFFMSPAIEEGFGMVPVEPSKAFMKKYGVEDEKKIPKMFAALYQFEGKNILLIRQATYSTEDVAERIAWYKAVLDQHGRFADVVVVDQTHNPGGYLHYALEFTSLFAQAGNQSQTQMRGLVNFLHPDRRWLKVFGTSLDETAKEAEKYGEERRLYELGYKLVEEAYDKGEALTRLPIGLTSANDYIQAPAGFSFKKPVLMLIDELAGSCGDIVPYLMKENKRAVLFGNRTIGLGGNVEEVLNLPSSQAGLHLTRGHFVALSPSGVYDMDNMVENNGVLPDIPYKHTLDDVRGGFTAYVGAFSKAATELAKASAADAAAAEVAASVGQTPAPAQVPAAK